MNDFGCVNEEPRPLARFEVGQGKRILDLLKGRARPFEELLRVYQEEPSTRPAVLQLMSALLMCRRPTPLEYLQLLIILSAADPADPCGPGAEHAPTVPEEWNAP